VGEFRQVAGLARMQPAGDRSSDGYAAVDAMVALAILAMTVTFAVGAAQTARRVAVAAEETRRATQLLRYLVDETPLTLAVQSGAASGFSWRVQTRLGADTGVPGLRLCGRLAELVSSTSHRRFHLEGAAICPPPS
jgi:hypothetical protein